MNLYDITFLDNFRYHQMLLVATFVCLSIAILASPLPPIAALILGCLCDILVNLLIFGVINYFLIKSIYVTTK